jgi:hypothetical protein
VAAYPEAVSRGTVHRLVIPTHVFADATLRRDITISNFEPGGTPFAPGLVQKDYIVEVM